MVKLTLHPFGDHLATLALTFTITDTKYNIFGLPFLQTLCKSIDSYHSQLILKNNLNITANIPNVPFLQVSHRQPAS